MAFRVEASPKLELTCSDSQCEDEDEVIELGVNDITKVRSSITVDEAARKEMILKAAVFTIDEDVVMPVKTTPNLKVYHPEPETKVHAHRRHRVR
jgi:hypothetical protein